MLISPVSRTWGWASLCLLALGILLFYLIDFARVLDGRFHGDPDYCKAHLFSEIFWDSLLFWAYVAGRLGWKTPMGIIGAGFSIPLLLFDMFALMPSEVVRLAMVSH